MRRPAVLAGIPLLAAAEAGPHAGGATLIRTESVCMVALTRGRRRRARRPTCSIPG
ncbi:hypothetical protein ACQP2P_30985 [Dactylosporangium sp. CA-139114]|uniref:hypothetical protein n=1 Tax=Dactylosporangium sp. CA-139114 TaxID=3239931 RepID=UPI003D97EF07